MYSLQSSLKQTETKKVLSKFASFTLLGKDVFCTGMFLNFIGLLHQGQSIFSPLLNFNDIIYHLYFFDYGGFDFPCKII